MTPDRLDDQLDGLRALGDPVRRALYRHVVAQDHAVGRDEAAHAVGVSRSLAAYHLDKLVEDDLLEARFERLGRRGGPGAGRPAKLYARSSSAFQVSVPPRDYETAARLLADALDDDEAAPGRVVALHQRAREFGAHLGAEADRSNHDSGAPHQLTSCLEELLAERGYEPYDDDGTIRVRNCPFHALAAEHQDLVCGMNLAVMEGVLQGIGSKHVQARLDPRAGECCVAFDVPERLRRPDQ
jgi:predicted ArsR family transcriptional regulator